MLKKYKIIGLAILVGASIISAIIFIQFRYARQSELANSIAQSKRIFAKQAKLTVPLPRSFERVTYDQLSSDEKPFILANSHDLFIQRIRYANGKVGYYVKYITDKDTAGSAIELLKISATNSPWHFITLLRSNVAGLYELRNASQELVIALNYLGDNHTEVILQFVL